MSMWVAISEKELREKTKNFLFLFLRSDYRITVFFLLILLIGSFGFCEALVCD